MNSKLDLESFDFSGFRRGGLILLNRGLVSQDRLLIFPIVAWLARIVF